MLHVVQSAAAEPASLGAKLAQAGRLQGIRDAPSGGAGSSSGSPEQAGRCSHTRLQPVCTMCSCMQRACTPYAALPHLAHCALRIGFVLGQLAAGEAPPRVLLVTPHQQALGAVGGQHDGTPAQRQSGGVSTGGEAGGGGSAQGQLCKLSSWLSLRQRGEPAAGMSAVATPAAPYPHLTGTVRLYLLKLA